MSANLLLRASDLSCARDQRVLFTLDTFALEAGDCVELRGANGSGKTTLLRALAGLFPYTGEVIRQAKPAFIGHRNGNSGLLTALENLRWHAGLTGVTGNEDQIRSALLDALERVGLLRAAGRLAHQLSQGQQRRLALARLLVGNRIGDRVGNVRLWLLDEPYTALDASGASLVDELLKAHCADGGAALIASHSPLLSATRVLVLDQHQVDVRSRAESAVA